MRKALIIALFSALFLHVGAQNFSYFGAAQETESRFFSLSNLNTPYGGVWYNDSLSLNNNFQISFSANFGCINNNGEGISFILSNSPSVSNLSGGMGVQGLQNTLAVEFDLNADTYDPNYDHAAIILNGNINHNNSLSNPFPLRANNIPVEDCNFHQITISWVASTRTIEVFFDCYPVLSKNISPSTLNQVLGNLNNVYWGISASNFIGNNVYEVEIIDASFPLPNKVLKACKEETATLHYTGGSYTFVTNTYHTQPSNDLISFTPTQNETIQVTASNSCGKNWTDELEIQVSDPYVINLEEDTFACGTDTVWLNVHQSDLSTLYAWNTGHNGPQIAPYNTGLYTVTVTNGVCTTSDSIQFYRETPPQIDLGNDTSICQGSSITLNTGSSNYNYLWSDGSVNNSISVNTSGSYSVDVSNHCGLASDTITVQLYPQLASDLGHDSTLCTGDTLLLQAPIFTNANYTWSTGSTTPYIEVTSQGNYVVTISNSCEIVTDNIVIDFNDVPNLQTYQDTFICSSASILLPSPTDADQFMWSNGTSNQPLQIDSAGTYTISAWNKCGFAQKDFDVVLISSPTVELGNDTIICSSSPVIYSFNSPFTDVVWSDGISTNDRVIATTGNYQVTVTNGCGFATDDINIEADDLPSIITENTLGLCPGTSLSLTADVENARTTSWYNGSAHMGSTIITSPGVYILEASSVCGSVSEEITVTLNDEAHVDLGNDTALCSGELLRITMAQNGIYEWSNGDNGNVAYLESPGVYTLTYASEDGCLATDTIQINAECPTKIFFPTAFTPNGDGLNDLFVPKGEYVYDYSLEIFNRWGDLIFESNTMEIGWDGKNSPDGVYIWRVSYQDETFTTSSEQGSVTLSRNAKPQ